MKPMLKPPGTMRLKLHCHILLSTFAFKFNLRRYTAAACYIAVAGAPPVLSQLAFEAGA